MINNLKTLWLFLGDMYFCIYFYVTEYLIVTEYSSPEQTAVQKLTTWCHLNILKMMLGENSESYDFTERWINYILMLLDKSWTDQASEKPEACLNIWKWHVWISIVRRGEELHVEVPEGE